MVATRFAVAAHLLLILAGAQRGLPGRNGGGATARARDGGTPATSGRLAIMVNTNPVVVRRITGQLARAGLIRVHRGPGGAELARSPAQISLDDIWRAVNAGTVRPLVPLHARARAAAGGGRDEDSDVHRIHDVLRAAFGEAESTFRAALARKTLDTLLRSAVHESA